MAHSPSNQSKLEACFDDPEGTVTCFFNSIFGHIRNWPRAHACLAPAARSKFESLGGLPSFADYWEDKLSFLGELVRRRHMEYPYRHRSCFSLDSIQCEEISTDHALIALELVENHLARERLVILQMKECSKQGDIWLLDNGELEGNLDEIIKVRGLSRRKASADSAGCA